MLFVFVLSRLSLSCHVDAHFFGLSGIIVERIRKGQNILEHQWPKPISEDETLSSLVSLAQ